MNNPRGRDPHCLDTAFKAFRFLKWCLSLMHVASSVSPTGSIHPCTDGSARVAWVLENRSTQDYFSRVAATGKPYVSTIYLSSASEDFPRWHNPCLRVRAISSGVLVADLNSRRRWQPCSIKTTRLIKASDRRHVAERDAVKIAAVHGLTKPNQEITTVVVEINHASGGEQPIGRIRLDASLSVGIAGRSMARAWLAALFGAMALAPTLTGRNCLESRQCLLPWFRFRAG